MRSKPKPTRAYQPSLLQTAPQILVTMYVSSEHPLLLLKRELDWPGIREVVIDCLRKTGHNVDHGPGRPLDPDLYVPLIVLQHVKNLRSREMEELLAESAVARVFIDWEHNARMQVRDHSNIARINEALGEDGRKRLNALIVNKAVALGFADPRTLSGDTTAQELPIGYPHEAGILKGLAERCVRAIKKLRGKGKRKLKEVQERFERIIYKAKEYHLFAKGKDAKNAILQSMVRATRSALREVEAVTERLSQETDRSIVSGTAQLRKMVEVGQQLLPQIVQWLATGVVAKGKILHAGITEARSIVRNKVGKKVEFGFQYLLGSIGGYLFAELIDVPTGETKMPVKVLAAYREVLGAEATPDLFVYDRGGWSQGNVKTLRDEGVKKVGIQPKGRARWRVHGTDRKRVLSERGQMEGRIGTLKTEKYGFNKPKDRKSANLKAAGQRSVLSYNLNKLMRDLMAARDEVAVAA